MSEFAPKYFYHLADTVNLASIRKNGLLSTEELLKLAGVNPRESRAILARHRPESLILPNGIVIRDQGPMPPEALAKALPKELVPSDWYKLLNKFVFLWPSIERLERHRRACGIRPQHMMVFDARRLFEELGDQIFLSPINSGNARRKPAARSIETLVAYKKWRTNGWPTIKGQTIRSRSFEPAEILVKGGMPLEPYLLDIQ